MTAKEEAKALAEKWLAQKRSFEMLLIFTDKSGTHWVIVDETNEVESTWNRCVGIRLLF